MTDYDSVDFFTDKSLVPDPYPYFEHLRRTCRVVSLPREGVVAITGYDDAVDVLRDTETFSSCNAVTGPFPGLRIAAPSNDITELVEQQRHTLPMADHLITMDGPSHAMRRFLLRRLLTPKRMRENEANIRPLADAHIDGFIDTGSFEVLSDFARPFAVLVIADLLGVPEEDRPEFREQLGTLELPEVKDREGTRAGASPSCTRVDPLQFLFDKFTHYIEGRRRDPQPGVLTDLATATYPDGSVPDVIDVVHTASFLFAAGGDTTTRLIAAALQTIAENPDIDSLLRTRRELLPTFIDEALRLESPVKALFRLTRKSTSVAGIPIPAGTTVMIPLGAANRDPDRYDDPMMFQPDRDNAQTHLSFGRGLHTCAGGPLARTEARISLERLLDRIAEFRISETHHGRPSEREFNYEPTYILRGHSALHLDFTAAPQP
jgi:cytochrome P450 family 150 subfamily A5